MLHEIDLLSTIFGPQVHVKNIVLMLNVTNNKLATKVKETDVL